MAYRFGHYVKIEPGDTLSIPINALGQKVRDADEWVGYCGYGGMNDVNILWYIIGIQPIVHFGTNLSPNGWNVVDTSDAWPCDATIGGTELPAYLDGSLKENLNENGYLEVTVSSSDYDTQPFLWIYITDYIDIYPPQVDAPPPDGYYPVPSSNNGYRFLVARQYPPWHRTGRWWPSCSIN